MSVLVRVRILRVLRRGVEHVVGLHLQGVARSVGGASEGPAHDYLPLVCPKSTTTSPPCVALLSVFGKGVHRKAPRIQAMCFHASSSSGSCGGASNLQLDVTLEREFKLACRKAGLLNDDQVDSDQ